MMFVYLYLYTITYQLIITNENKISMRVNMILKYDIKYDCGDLIYYLR